MGLQKCREMHFVLQCLCVVHLGSISRILMFVFKVFRDAFGVSEDKLDCRLSSGRQSWNNH